MSARPAHTVERVPVGDGRVMSVRVSGSGAPVLLLHGIPGSADGWDAVAERLAPHHTVLVPDLLGFGESSRPRNTDDLHAAAQARALVACLERLAPGGTAVLGHDFGGPVALLLVAARPELVTHVVLAATNVFPDAPIPLPISAVTWPVVGRVAAPLLFSGPSLRLMLRQGSATPGADLDPRAHLGNRGQRRAIATIFAASLRRLEELYAPVEDALRGLRVPALVAWGDRDPFFSVDQGRRTAAAAPGARFVLYEGCGHFVPLERPAELAADVAELLREPRRAAA